MKLSVSLVALLGVATDGAFVADLIPRHQKAGGSSNGKGFEVQDHFQPQAPMAPQMQHKGDTNDFHPIKEQHIEMEPVVASENLDGNEVISTLPDGRTINTADPNLTATAFTTNQFNAQNMLQCTAGALTLQTQCMTPEMYDDITSEIQFVHQNSATGAAQADFAGCILRMAGHDFMDHMPASSGAPAGERGGSDGCVDFGDPDNGGLAACLQQLDISYNKVGLSSFNNAAVCEKVSLADFLVIAGEAVMEITKVTTSDIGFKDGRTASTTQRFGVASTTGTGFEFGRTTATDCEWGRHRLPNPENHCLDGELKVTPSTDTTLPFGGTSVKTNFVDALGLNWKESATLMGVHTLGRTGGATISGYEGWWSVPEEQGKFNNDYYKSIIQRGWAATVGPGHTGFGAGDTKKVQWNWVGLGSDSPANMPVMMLSSDMCLFYDMRATLSQGGLGACAWNIQGGVGNNPLLPGPTTEDPAQAGFHCGSTNPPQGLFPALGDCCGSGTGGASTDSINFPGGPGVLFPGDASAVQTPQHLRDLARSNTFFYSEFLKVWTKATTNGFENTLTPLQAQCSNVPSPSPPTDSPTLSPTIAVTTKPTTNFPTKFPTKKGAPPTLPPTRFPTPAPTLGSGSEPTCWTPWFNRDTPSGTGEWETLQALSKENPQAFIDAGCGFDIYSNTVGTPKGVECADAYSPMSLANLFDDFTNGIKCTPEEGLVCLTSDQPYGTCSNYRIRFNCCESSDEAAGSATTLTFQDDDKKECKMIMKDGKLVSTCPIEAPLSANSDPSFIRSDVNNLEKRMTALEERMNTRISAIERNL